MIKERERETGITITCVLQTRYNEHWAESTGQSRWVFQILKAPPPGPPVVLGSPEKAASGSLIIPSLGHQFGACYELVLGLESLLVVHRASGLTIGSERTSDKMQTATCAHVCSVRTALQKQRNDAFTMAPPHDRSHDPVVRSRIQRRVRSRGGDQLPLRIKGCLF